MTNFVSVATIDSALAEPFRAGRIQWLRRPGGGERETLSAGYWFVGPDDVAPRTLVPIHVDETLVIIEGSIIVEVNGVEHPLIAGDSLSINGGSETFWTVLQQTIEFFVYS